MTFDTQQLNGLAEQNAKNIAAIADAHGVSSRLADDVTNEVDEKLAKILSGSGETEKSEDLSADERTMQLIQQNAANIATLAEEFGVHSSKIDTDANQSEEMEQFAKLLGLPSDDSATAADDVDGLAEKLS